MNESIMLEVQNQQGQLDCPKDMKVYFNTKQEAADYGSWYIKENKLYMAVLLKLLPRAGHYRTLAYIHNPELV